VPASRQHISKAIAERSEFAGQSPRDQWRLLVLDPLSKLGDNDCPGSFLLVVDALDECDKEDNIRMIVQLLAEAPSLSRARLRVFLTSRPEVPIRHGFRNVPDAKHQDFVLHNISPSIVDRDISLFLGHSLGRLAMDRDLRDWPSESDVETLVRNAGGLFIWAATASRFIKEAPFVEERLRTLLRNGPSATVDDESRTIYDTVLQLTITNLIWYTGGVLAWATIALGLVRNQASIEEWLYGILVGRAVTPQRRLDWMYITILQGCATPTWSSREKQDFYNRLRYVLGSTVTLLSPLPIAPLSRLLGVTETTTVQTFKDLHAILDIPREATAPLRLHHPSFRDFLSNKDRCSHSNFWVDEKLAHQRLARNCIQTMSSSLKQDICMVGARGALAAELDRTQLQQYLSLELQYACNYWIQHLARSDAQLRDDDQVHSFLQEHCLHWLEVLGWMGKVPEGLHTISSLMSMTGVSHFRKVLRPLLTTAQTSSCPGLYALVHDMNRFVLHSRSAFEQAPLQVYCSALVFAPSGSMVKRQFEGRIPGWIKRLPQVESEWSAVMQTLEGHLDYVSTVAFSPDGKVLASASYDFTASRRLNALPAPSL
jgi:hypothetical protein